MLALIDDAVVYGAYPIYLASAAASVFDSLPDMIR